MAEASPLIHAHFSIHTTQNEAKSRAAGRPIYDEMEICTLRAAANKLTVWVFPAHEVFKWHNDPNTGMREPLTYALAYPEQYKKFKSNEAQTMAGTPLAELPFLSASKRLELKALSIHTAEALAALDGQNLKNLGMGGRELKNQAQAYLDKAAGTADVTRLAADNVDLREQIAAMQRDMAAMIAASKGKSPLAEPEEDKAIEDLTDAELKAYIKRERGSGVPGNPSHETLFNLAMEIATTRKVA